jgi:hypothetical protein
MYSYEELLKLSVEQKCFFKELVCFTLTVLSCRKIESVFLISNLCTIQMKVTVFLHVTTCRK